MNMKKQKVAHIVWNYLPKSNEFVYNQITQCKYFSPVVLCERFYPESLNTPVIHYMYSNPKTPRGIWHRGTRRWRPTWHAGWFEKQALKSGCSLIHAHFGVMGAILAAAERKPALPLVVSFYGKDASADFRNQKEIYMKLFEIADRIIVQGEKIKERFVLAGCDSSRISVWDIGIDLLQFPYIPRDVMSKTVKFLVAARFVEKKGYFVLLRAFKRLLGHYPDIELTIIGFGHLENKIRTFISLNGIEDKVGIIISSEQADFYSVFTPLLQNHHIFVLSAVQAGDGDEDGLPVVIQNAQASGMPVISTPVGAISNAIIHRQTGLLAEEGSVDSLVEMMNYLITNRSEWNHLGSNARLHAEKHFALGRQIQRLEDIYEDVLT